MSFSTTLRMEEEKVHFLNIVKRRLHLLSVLNSEKSEAIMTSTVKANRFIGPRSVVGGPHSPKFTNVLTIATV